MEEVFCGTQNRWRSPTIRLTKTESGRFLTELSFQLASGKALLGTSVDDHEPQKHYFKQNGKQCCCKILHFPRRMCACILSIPFFSF